MAQIRAEHRKIGYRALAHLPAQPCPRARSRCAFRPATGLVGGDLDRPTSSDSTAAGRGSPGPLPGEKRHQTPLNRRPVQRPAIRRMTSCRGLSAERARSIGGSRNCPATASRSLHGNVPSPPSPSICRQAAAREPASNWAPFRNLPTNAGVGAERFALWARSH